MQTLKKEMRDEILRVAKNEILQHGYINASLRVIAKKAHTTLGNLYNYFDSKEAMLEAIIGDVPQKIDQLFAQPIKRADIEEIIAEDNIHKVEQLLEDKIPQVKKSIILLEPEVIILLECCEGTKYETYAEHFYEMTSEYLSHYLEKGYDKESIRIQMHALEAAFVYIAKEAGNTEEGKRQLIEYIKLFLIGLLYKQRNFKISINFISNL